MAAGNMELVVPSHIDRPHVLCRSEDIPLVVYSRNEKFDNVVFLGPAKDALVISETVPTESDYPRVLCRSEDVPLIVETSMEHLNKMVFLGQAKDSLVISGQRLNKDMKNTEVSYGKKVLCYQTTFRK